MKGVTSHQVEVLKLVAASEVPLDLDQLLPQLSWSPSKEAAQFTIRALVTKGLLLKLPLKLRRGRLRVSYEMTAKGALVLDPRGPMPAETTAISAQKTEEIDDIQGLFEV